MGLSRRLRNIAKSQINAIKDRLDRVDEEEEASDRERRFEADARNELDDPAQIRPARRTPEEIAAGAQARVRSAQAEAAGSSAPAPAAPTNPLAIHYKRLGLPEGADLSAIESAHAGFAARCAPDRFPDGSEDQKTAAEIFRRVQASYEALRDALDSTAGRFDKLEL